MKSWLMLVILILKNQNNEHQLRLPLGSVSRPGAVEANLQTGVLVTPGINVLKSCSVIPLS
jgi:hypothetical protein